MEVKYVVLDELYPIVFCGALQHKDMADKRRITSAGFCKISIDKATGEIETFCYGKSVSLNITPKENDNVLIKLLINDLWAFDV